MAAQNGKTGVPTGSLSDNHIFLVRSQTNLYIIEYKQVCTRRSIAPVYEKQYAQSSPNKSMAPFSIQKKVLRVNNRFGYAIPADRGYWPDCQCSWQILMECFYKSKVYNHAEQKHPM